MSDGTSRAIGAYMSGEVDYEDFCAMAQWFQAEERQQAKARELAQDIQGFRERIEQKRLRGE